MRVILLILAITFFSCGSNKDSKKKIILKRVETSTNEENALMKLIPKEKNNKEFDCTIKVDKNCDYYFNKSLIKLSNLKDSLKTLKQESKRLKAKLLIDKEVKMEKTLEIMNIAKELEIKLILEAE
ncbi:ExbD/TolR family protein [Marinifilum flexuosum]|uniref:ExbD/TolR family protein n=1 Tax=Marinifilum flexuosum TaxID=1117708 RepID=UPI0031ED2F15